MRVHVLLLETMNGHPGWEDVDPTRRSFLGWIRDESLEIGSGFVVYDDTKFDDLILKTSPIQGLKPLKTDVLGVRTFYSTYVLTHVGNSSDG